jgi:hypothetical protein
MDNREIKKIIWSLVMMVIILLVMNGENWYWRYWPHNPITVCSLKISPETRTVYPGGFIYYTIEYEKNMDIIPTIHRQLVNTFVYTLSPTFPGLKPIGRNKTTAIVPIPRMAEYGEYQMRWTAVYEIGPEKRVITRTAISDTFRVIPDPKETKGAKGRHWQAGAKG